MTKGDGLPCFTAEAWEVTAVLAVEMLEFDGDREVVLSLKSQKSELVGTIRL